jgi:hypothetical protein
MFKFKFKFKFKFNSLYSLRSLSLYSEGTQATCSTLDPVACLLMVSFLLVLLPLCLIISVDSHPLLSPPLLASRAHSIGFL